MNWLRRKKPDETSNEKTPDSVSADSSGNEEVTSDKTPPPNDGDVITPVDNETDGAPVTQSVSAVSDDSNMVYPKGFRLAVIFISLCFAVFLVALDQTIIATAMYSLSCHC